MHSLHARAAVVMPAAEIEQTIAVMIMVQRQSLVRHLRTGFSMKDTPLCLVCVCELTCGEAESGWACSSAKSASDCLIPLARALPSPVTFASHVEGSAGSCKQPVWTQDKFKHDQWHKGDADTWLHSPAAQQRGLSYLIPDLHQCREQAQRCCQVFLEKKIEHADCC